MKKKLFLFSICLVLTFTIGIITMGTNGEQDVLTSARDT